MGRDEEVVAVVARSRALRDLRRPQAALHLVMPALAAHPDAPELLVEAARCRLGVGGRSNLGPAIELLRRAIALEPEDATAVALLGASLTVTFTRAREGEQLLDRACEMAPFDADVAYARATALEQRSVVRWDKAHAAVLHAVALAPQNPQVLLLKATVDRGRLGPYDTQGRATLVADIQAVLAIDPGNADAAYLLAQVTGTGAAPAARAESFRQGVRLDPRHGEAIQRVDSSLVAPLRGGYWVVWFLVVLQAGLLWCSVSWGTALNVVLFVFALVVPWVRFRAARRSSPPGFGRHGGRDPLLWTFGLLTYLGAFALKVSLDGFGGALLLWVCVAILTAAGAAYLVRSGLRRHRYG
ncbi:hypothetical protein [Lapillicoccus sp.]|uniref:tetratricopeptide repeat protein n=1 Tax=Lapillicoccus sp. TaxID=1909287 RepID=UPI0032634681